MNPQSEPPVTIVDTPPIPPIICPHCNQPLDCLGTTVQNTYVITTHRNDRCDKILSIGLLALPAQQRPILSVPGRM